MSREYRDMLVKAAPEGDELEEKARGRGLVPRGSMAKLRIVKRAMLRVQDTPGYRGPKGIGADRYIPHPQRSKLQRRREKLSGYARRRFGAPVPFV